MATDAVVSRELQSLQDELSAAQRERLAPTAPTAASPGPAESAAEGPGDREIHDQLRELASEVTHFFDEAEKNIAAHPTQSVIGAFLLGIIVGRLLARW